MTHDSTLGDGGADRAPVPPPDHSSRHATAVRRLAAWQRNRCGLCANALASHDGTTRRVHVDRDSATGRVRGVLCPSCNVAVARYQDPLSSHRRDSRIAAYLRTPPADAYQSTLG